MSNKLSVICAVWHLDKNRKELLKNHMRCLDNQDIPVERVYVFDGNDDPPKWLKGEVITSRTSLTIYEAWNLALSRVSTPYVMNLNLDDRLHQSASKQLIEALDSGADLVGGEWEICFTQEDTDSMFYTEEMNFYPEWPPKTGVKTKLGSGSGQRGTYGPACAWKMGLHIEFPRYPYLFSNELKIKVIGDLLWWILLNSKGKKLTRINNVIGKYYSHPNEQAEFRTDVNEIELAKNYGIKLI